MQPARPALEMPPSYGRPPWHVKGGRKFSSTACPGPKPPCSPMRPLAPLAADTFGSPSPARPRLVSHTESWLRSSSLQPDRGQSLAGPRSQRELRKGAAFADTARIKQHCPHPPPLPHPQIPGPPLQAHDGCSFYTGCRNGSFRGFAARRRFPECKKRRFFEGSPHEPAFRPDGTKPLRNTTAGRTRRPERRSGLSVRRLFRHCFGHGRRFVQTLRSGPSKHPGDHPQRQPVGDTGRAGCSEGVGSPGGRPKLSRVLLRPRSPTTQAQPNRTGRRQTSMHQALERRRQKLELQSPTSVPTYLQGLLAARSGLKSKPSRPSTQKAHLVGQWRRVRMFPNPHTQRPPYVRTYVRTQGPGPQHSDRGS